MKPMLILPGIMLVYSTILAQQFNFPTSGNAVNNQLAALTAPDGVTLITSIRSSGCTPGGGSTFRFGTDHVSTGAIYRNTSWATGCIGSRDVIKMDFTSQGVRPQGLKFSIYDVDNGSDSVSVLMYKGEQLLDYSYSLYSPTFVTAHGASPSFGFVGSGGNNSGQDDNRGRIDIMCTDILARVDSVIVTKYNNRDVVGNPSQSFAAFEWTNFVVLPLQILSFTGKPGSNGASFSWTATGEQPNTSYQLTVSSNGSDFTPAGFPVAAKATGNTQQYTQELTYTKSPVFFARLQSKAINGKMLYSEIIRISRLQSTTSTVYPVVFDGKVTLSLTSQGATIASIRLVGMDGVQHFVQTLPLQDGTNSVSLALPPRLAKGVYQLCYRLDDGRVGRHALLKQ